MIDKNILDKIQFAGAVDQVRGLQSSYLNRILDFGRLARVIENEALNGSEAYSLDELMSDLKNGIFSELKIIQILIFTEKYSKSTLFKD